MRGKGKFNVIGNHIARITPAYAGKRPLYLWIVGIKRDHPRLCGEKTTMQKRNSVPRGSPPPMRGKVFYGFAVRNGFGITPAYAGKSCIQL